MTLATNRAEALDLLLDGHAVAAPAAWVDDLLAACSTDGLAFAPPGRWACLVTLPEAPPAPPPPSPAWGWSRQLPPTSPAIRRPSRARGPRRPADRTVEELRELAPGLTRRRHLRRGRQ